MHWEITCNLIITSASHPSAILGPLSVRRCFGSHPTIFELFAFYQTCPWIRINSGSVSLGISWRQHYLVNEGIIWDCSSLTPRLIAKLSKNDDTYRKDAQTRTRVEPSFISCTRYSKGTIHVNLNRNYGLTWADPATSGPTRFTFTSEWASSILAVSVGMTVWQTFYTFVHI